MFRSVTPPPRSQLTLPSGREARERFKSNDPDQYTTAPPMLLEQASPDRMPATGRRRGSSITSLQLKLFTEQAGDTLHKDYEPYYVTTPAPYKAFYVGHDQAAHGFNPLICQPTPEGLELMIKDFCKMNPACDLRMEDQRGIAGNPSVYLPRFRALKEKMQKHPEEYEPTPSHPIGIILSHGQSHAIPVFLAKEGEEKYMFIFDSTSGGAKFGYKKVAALFPEYRVMLNNGTRQADGQSCITDAFEIITRAFRVDNLTAKINEKIIDRELLRKEHESTTAHSRLKIPRPAEDVANFDIFRMPEELCFTAQNTQFITEQSQADMQKVIVGPDGETTSLSHFLKDTKAKALFMQRKSSDSGSDSAAEAQMEEVFKSINPYLHLRSWKHAETIRRLVIPSASPVASLATGLPDA